jgi:hypothetical protein
MIPEEVKKKLFEAYGRPVMVNKEEGITISFSRQSEKDVKQIEEMTTDKLIEEWKSYTWMNYIYGCVSLGDMQRIDFIQIELSSRLTQEEVDKLQAWYKEAQTEFKENEDKYFPSN